jgi:hypothetical protein
MECGNRKKPRLLKALWAGPAGSRMPRRGGPAGSAGGSIARFKTFSFYTTYRAMLTEPGSSVNPVASENICSMLAPSDPNVLGFPEVFGLI